MADSTTRCVIVTPAVACGPRHCPGLRARRCISRRFRHPGGPGTPVAGEIERAGGCATFVAVAVSDSLQVAQGRARPRSLRGPLMARLVSPDRAGHRSARLHDPGAAAPKSPVAGLTLPQAILPFQPLFRAGPAATKPGNSQSISTACAASSQATQTGDQHNKGPLVRRPVGGYLHAPPVMTPLRPSPPIATGLAAPQVAQADPLAELQEGQIQPVRDR
jgi:hypothetical protein